MSQDWASTHCSALHIAAGAELDKLGGSDFCAAVRRATVLGKLTPGQKARVVAALKGIGHTGAASWLACPGRGPMGCMPGT